MRNILFLFKDFSQGDCLRFIRLPTHSKNKVESSVLLFMEHEYRGICGTREEEAGEVEPDELRNITRDFLGEHKILSEEKHAEDGIFGETDAVTSLFHISLYKEREKSNECFFLWKSMDGASLIFSRCRNRPKWHGWNDRRYKRTHFPVREERNEPYAESRRREFQQFRNNRSLFAQCRSTAFRQSQCPHTLFAIKKLHERNGPEKQGELLRILLLFQHPHLRFVLENYALYPQIFRETQLCQTEGIAFLFLFFHRNSMFAPHKVCVHCRKYPFHILTSAEYLVLWKDRNNLLAEIGDP